MARRMLSAQPPEAAKAPKRTDEELRAIFRSRMGDNPTEGELQAMRKRDIVTAKPADDEGEEPDFMPRNPSSRWLSRSHASEATRKDEAASIAIDRLRRGRYGAKLEEFAKRHGEEPTSRQRQAIWKSLAGIPAATEPAAKPRRRTRGLQKRTEVNRRR